MIGSERKAGACGLAVAALVAAMLLPLGAAAQQSYASPQLAVDALIAAERSNDQATILDILGKDAGPLIYSGDPVADEDNRHAFLAHFDEAHRIDAEGDASAALVIGKDDWSLPIPLLKQGEVWRFDTDAGLQKILDRRIGRNELSVIQSCRAYVEAQRDYAALKPAGDGITEYAGKFISSEGRHDGLYWPAAAGAAQSPLGPLYAAARAEGYGNGAESGKPHPYHGYYFKILTRQGSHAPGGAKDYVVKGRLTRGFALLAYPATWGDSGIMTFEVNQSGIVFEKNLGPHTARLASRIRAFDPDLSWTPEKE